MSLVSWSEASMLRNIRRLDPFQRGMQTTLAQTGHQVRFYTAIDGAIARAIAGGK